MFDFDWLVENEPPLQPGTFNGRCVIYRTGPNGDEFRCNNTTSDRTVLCFHCCAECYDAISKD